MQEDIAPEIEESAVADVLLPEVEVPDVEDEVAASEVTADEAAEADHEVDEEPGWLIAVRAARQKQAIGIRVLDLRDVTTFTDYFVICNGTNTRQNQAITDGIEMELRKRGERPHCIEGYENGEWILSDYSDFLVHVFTTQSREYYSLERLWREGKEVALPPDPALAGLGEQSVSEPDPEPVSESASEPS